MSVQQFCLRWNNHQPNFISVFSTLLHNETLVDVTLAAEGRQLQAHKVVLSACSSYFQTLFTTNPCQHPIVILKDVQYIHLKTMVDFMYYGEVNVSQEQLPHILKTAEMLKIKGLAEMPDATSLTKSESKSSSSDHIEQITGGTVGNESIWGSTESQQFHHQQQRRTPSPASLSPATRRKRLRKSSTGSGTLSTERTSEEQSSIDGGSNLNIGQMDPMTTFVPSSGNISSNINNSRILKETSSTETEHPHQESSQESVEESMHHSSSAVMKTDDDMGSVSHTMPLDIAGSTSNTGQQQQQQQQQPAVSCPQPQPGVQWTLIDSNYPRFYQPGLGMQTPTGQNNTDAHQNNSNNHNNNNSNSNNTNNNNNNSNNNPNAGNTHPNTTNEENTGVQTLQYQQNPAYSPQIISVNPNSLMNSYQSSLSNPTSPSQENESMVQSVYSQGPTPAQSPIQQIGNQGSNSSGSQMPVKRKRSVNPQGDENFIRALEAVRYGGIGFCKAARLYGVNNRTLWLEYKKRGYPISRPSIKSRIKLEPNMTPPPPTTPNNEENTMENYDQLTPTAINMATVPSTTEPTTPLMCPPHAHPMGVMSFLDSRHVEFPTAIHSMSRQRYADPSVNVNPTAMNLQGLNFNSM